jgi:acyl carrier protein
MRKEEETKDVTATLDSAEITTKVQAFIVDNFLFGDAAPLSSDADSFIQKGILDSTGILELIQFIEGEFGITVQDSETLPENLDSLAAVTAYIQRKRASQ